MRLIGIAVVLGMLVTAAPLEAQTPLQKKLTGSWIFTWDRDPNNTNPAELKYEAGTITGIYINDAEDKCPLVGRVSPQNTVILTITCPKWDIRAEGSLTDKQEVVGKYIAYGNLRGEFKMSKR